MSVEERVVKIVCEQLGVGEDEVNTGSSFVDDLGADSLDTVELVMALEEEFDLEIADEEAEKEVKADKESTEAVQEVSDDSPSEDANEEDK